MDARSGKSRLSRREFLRGATAAGAALALSRWLPRAATVRRSAPASPAVAAHRVVHAHNDGATSWGYATGWYGDYVSQAVVDEMTDQGVTALTDTSTRADAWRALIPAYTPGQIVAIKINLVNASCADEDQHIDALPQPINSVIRGLKETGVSEPDIWVYDMTDANIQSQMPARLVNKVIALYPDVQFHSCLCSTTLGFSATQKIHFNVPSGKPAITDRPICNALVNAFYLINMPIMKKHDSPGVTLGFKNHFGSFEHCYDVHWTVIIPGPDYTSAYSGLVDVYNNTHFKTKTVLTVGDGLYGARFHYNDVPSPWPSFGDKSPNSLFFSIDPVAMDCVMYDHLAAEVEVPIRLGADDYLKLAANQENPLGVFEHWNAAHQYQTIDYRRIERRVYVPLIRRDDDWRP